MTEKDHEKYFKVNRAIFIGLIMQIALILFTAGAFWQRVTTLENSVSYIQKRLDQHMNAHAHMSGEQADNSHGSSRSDR